MTGYLRLLAGVAVFVLCTGCWEKLSGPDRSEVTITLGCPEGYRYDGVRCVPDVVVVPSTWVVR